MIAFYIFWGIIILLLVVASIGVVAALGIEIPKFKSKPESKPVEQERVKLSLPSDAIYDLYLRLPESNRPMSAEEMLETLEALDVKHGANRVNDHFLDGYFEYFSWACCDARALDECRYKEYHVLRNDISAIISALAEQKHVLAIAAVQDRLDALDTITARLREERALIRDVTKELSNGN